jgi:hypothetical protein
VVSSIFRVIPRSKREIYIPTETEVKQKQTKIDDKNNFPMINLKQQKKSQKKSK